MQKIKLYNAHCCGEVGDVVIEIDNLNFKSPKQGSIELFKDQYWRNFFLNEPRGGVFKHCNIIVKPSNPIADAGFIIMEPEDNPPMSGSNCICVTTVLLEKKILEMNQPLTSLNLEAPGGIIKVVAECEKNKVKNVSLTNLPSFVDTVDFNLKTKNYGTICVSTAYGGDSFLLCNAKDFNLKILPENANSFVTIAREILQEANEQIGFSHPGEQSWNHISFCAFCGPLSSTPTGLEGKSAVAVRPGKIDRSPTGTAVSARMALMHAKGLLQIGQTFDAFSIINSKFTGRIVREENVSDKPAIIPEITGRAWITGTHQHFLDPDDPWPEGYRLKDTWGF